MATASSTHGSHVSQHISENVSYVLDTLSNIIFGDQHDDTFEREVRVLFGRPMSSEDTCLLVEAIQTEATLLRQELTALNPSALPDARENRIISRTQACMALIEDLRSKGSAASGLPAKGHGWRTDLVRVSC